MLDADSRSRFLPFLKSSGTIVIDGKAIDVGGEAMLVHAIQGMRPDSVSAPGSDRLHQSLIRRLDVARVAMELCVLH
jgi:hypothetical protein